MPSSICINANIGHRCHWLEYWALFRQEGALRKSVKRWPDLAFNATNTAHTGYRIVHKTAIILDRLPPVCYATAGNNLDRFALQCHYRTRGQEQPTVITSDQDRSYLYMQSICHAMHNVP